VRAETIHARYRCECTRHTHVVTSIAWRTIDDDVDWSIYGPTHSFRFVGYRRGKVAGWRTLGESPRIMC